MSCPGSPSASASMCRSQGSSTGCSIASSMWIIVSSVLLGLIGVVASRIGLTYLTADGASCDPHAYWALGLVTLLSAWLVAFVGLLGTTPGVRPQLVSGAAWLLSIAAGLIFAVAPAGRGRGAGGPAQAQPPPRLSSLGSARLPTARCGAA